MQPTLPSSPGCLHEIRNVCKGLGQSCTQRILVATHPTVSWPSHPDKGMGTLPCNGKPSGVLGRKATSVIRTVVFISRQQCAQVTWRKAGPQRGRIPRYLLAVSFAHRLLLSSLNKILNLDAESMFTVPTCSLCYFPRTTGRQGHRDPTFFPFVLLPESCSLRPTLLQHRCILVHSSSGHQLRFHLFTEGFKEELLFCQDPGNLIIYFYFWNSPGSERLLLAKGESIFTGTHHFNRCLKHGTETYT